MCTSMAGEVEWPVRNIPVFRPKVKKRPISVEKMVDDSHGRAQFAIV